jgi:ribosomal protein S12 methylthiotransferase accessory factor
MRTHKAIFPKGKRVDVKYDNFTIATDQNINEGGEGNFPDPFNYFLSSLVACAGHYANSFYTKRGIETSKMNLTQQTTFNTETKLIEKIEFTLELDSSFPEKYDKAVIKSMNFCAVKKQLRTEIEVEINIKRK